MKKESVAYVRSVHTWLEKSSKNRKIAAIGGFGVASFIFLIFFSDLSIFRILITTLWLEILLYCSFAFKSRLTLFLFTGCFGLFLLWRDNLGLGWGYRVTELNTTGNPHTDIALFLALSSVIIGYLLAPKLSKIISKYGFANKHFHHISTPKWLSKKNIQSTTISLFLIIALPLISLTLYKIYIVFKAGYLAQFTGDTNNSYFPETFQTLLTSLEIGFNLCYFILISTRPTRQVFISTTTAWMFFLTLTLATGRRTQFFTAILVLIVIIPNFFPITRELSRRAKAIVTSVVIAVIIGAAGLGQFVELRRRHSSQTYTTSNNFLLDFLFNQGISVTVIRNGYSLADHISNAHFYTFSFLRTGLFARLRGIQVNHGNTISHALDGSSYTHALGYTLLPEDKYLSGVGVGGCYIAETYHDFSYAGVIIGSLLIGILLYWCSTYSANSPIISGIKILILSELFFTPRGSTLHFISTLLSPSSILTIAGIIVCTFLLGKYPPRRSLIAAKERSK